MTSEEKKALLIRGEFPRSVTGSTVYRTGSSLMAYLGCIAVTLGVMYFLDGTAGILMTTALICALVISLALTLVVMRSIKVEAEPDRQALNKGDELTCIIKMSKSIPLPSPLIEFRISCSKHLSAETELYMAALAGRETNVLKIPLTVRHSGEATVTIYDICISDFLGIFRFRLKTAIPEEPIKLAVYPDIPDAAVQTDFLRTTTQFANSDEDEEETDETAIGLTGMPGYDHRQYFPGDPIKRINWKLSSKRDIYMLRLDEKIVGAGQMFFLDAPVYEESDYTLSVRDNVIEGALAMFTMLIREGREASFFHAADGLWLRTDIRSMADIYRLQELLGSLSPCRMNDLLPTEIINAGKTPICFTAAVADRDEQAVQIVSQQPEALLISAASSGIPLICTNQWTVSTEFEFRKLSG